MARALFAPLLPVLLLCGGCAGEQPATTVDALQEAEKLLTGEAQLDRMCARPNADVVTDLFCHGAAPPISGIADLRDALGLRAATDELEHGFAITGHSTSLVRRSVSAINPRMIYVRRRTEDREITALAFARGEQFSEIVVRNRFDGELQFYLVKFYLPCEERAEGCTHGDLLTESTESGWTGYDIYGEEDLVNTPLDCRVCHQPAGPGTQKLLRMQELEAPWNHWFFRLSEGGQSLIEDYYAAKGEESFAGVPGVDIRYSQPGLLAFAVSTSSPPQTNLFASREIQDEVERSAAELGGNQPLDNTVPGQSETWNEINERANDGEAIPVPYHDVKVTDPEKLAAMTRAYADYRAGNLAREALPDIRDIYPDDPELMGRMGLSTRPGMSGEEVLLQACSLCHNEKLDQTVSRSRFDVDLSRVDRDTRERAIARIQLPRDSSAAMPPSQFRQLSDEARERLIELLRR
jgi:hypothetical protein